MASEKNVSICVDQEIKTTNMNNILPAPRESQLVQKIVRISTG